MKFERLFDVVDNIQLRPFTDSDAPEFARAVLESLDTLAPWMPWAHASYNMQDALDWFAMCRAAEADSNAYEFGIFSRKTIACWVAVDSISSIANTVFATWAIGFVKAINGKALRQRVSIY